MVDDVSVKEKDITAIEKEIAEKEQSKEVKLKADIEAKIRDDLAKEKEMDEMKAKVAAYEESKKKLEEERLEYEKNLKLQAEQHEEELKKLKSEMGFSKQIHNPTLGQNVQKQNYDKETLDEIEEESRKKAFEQFDLNRRRG